MQIKYYDTLKELFGADRTTDKWAATLRERIQQLDKDLVDLNDSFENTRFSDINIHYVPFIVSQIN
ncbi:hypothetical protein Ahy_A04g019057 [Arachis hypogaea]|uniref:Uncharacterized protein n=1 Tax=Arachis hypogaea TaxID=3818 RepID=A0A445DF71_ARAHY|nr:hypothetical protein Ahy_A04g019057 [Arachis hypogaea]